MNDFGNTLLIACIPAVVSGILSFIGAKLQSNNEIKKLKIENSHELDHLMEQHKVDIENIREQHKLELEIKEKDHKYKMEIMQKEHENELIRQEREQENNFKYSTACNATTGILGMFNGLMNTPEIKEQLSKKFIANLSKKE